MAKVIGHSGLVALALAAGAVLVAGCANEKGYNGDPGARPLPPGQTCESLRSSLNKLDARGVRSKVESSTSGQKLSPAAKADVDEYNKLLNDYLGARCHTAPKT